MDSITQSIKKLLGPTEDYTHFDADIILHINSAFASLQQLGVGPEEGFTIQDAGATWQDYFGDEKTLEFVKTYIFTCGSGCCLIRLPWALSWRP